MKPIKEKQVQLPYSILMRLFKYFLIEPTEEDHKAIKKALEVKLDAMIGHELYTQSKTSTTPEEKEKARLKYLDHVGMKNNFRW